MWQVFPDSMERDVESGLIPLIPFFQSRYWRETDCGALNLLGSIHVSIVKTRMELQ